MIRATIGGPETITLPKEVLTDVYFRMVTPKDSNARSTDQYIEVVLEGKINPSVASAEGEPTVALDNWANVADDRADAYRPVEVEVIEQGVVIRKYNLPHAFVVNYNDDFSDAEGIGKFRLQIRQKKDKSADVSVEGGFSS